MTSRPSSTWGAACGQRRTYLCVGDHLGDRPPLTGAQLATKALKFGAQLVPLSTASPEQGFLKGRHFGPYILGQPL